MNTLSVHRYFAYKGRGIALFFAALAVFFAALPHSASAQDILSADQFFNKLSDKYASVNDYEAAIVITTGSQTMTGKLAFKSPSLLRIDFSSPADQVILFSGSRLLVYIPQSKAVLVQDTNDSGSTGAAGAGLASREGLALMKRSYTFAWESSPTPVSLGPNSPEQVQRLTLSRKAVSEGFRTIKLSVSPDTLLIRRIEGWTLANDKITFDFTQIKTNQNISANRFLYDPPANATVYNNFLFQ